MTSRTKKIMQIEKQKAEIAQLKAERAKYQNILFPVIFSEKRKPFKPVKHEPEVSSKPKHVSHIAACQVIITAMNGSERRCRNYARKGLDCCYSHRKLEVENQEEIVANVVNTIFENVIYNVRMDYIREK